jgi:transcriptional regulator with XRE-family HTH domain
MISPMKGTIGEADIRYLVGKNLRRLRGLQNLSQMGLSSRADLTHNFINDIEKGKKWMSVETLAKLASALKVEPYQFFLPDSVSPENANSFFTVYLDDFSDSVQKMLGELKNRYIQDMEE